MRSHYWLQVVVLTGCSSALLTGRTCIDGSASQAFVYGTPTATSISTHNGSSCLTVAAWPEVPHARAHLTFAPCGAGPSAAQAFLFDPRNGTLALAADAVSVAALADFNTTPGTEVWLGNAVGCKGNCDWRPRPSGGGWANAASGLCLDDGSGSGGVAPQTCAHNSPVAARPMCNASLPFTARAADLLSLLSLNEKVRYWGSLTQNTADFAIPYNAATNVKSFFWVTTCIHGLSGNPSPSANVTVFPHASSLGATFDVELIAAVGAVTAVEGRVVNQRNYRLTQGETFQAVSCPGGPLANTVHDQRWGRVAESYGEDPLHVSRMGVAHMVALQNRSALTTTGDYFVQLSQVTRHLLGFHSAQADLPHGGVETISPQWLVDQQVPVFRAFMTEGAAEGVMCSMNSMNGVPSCVNPLLYGLLRAWNSTAFVQTDCCDSIATMVDELHTYATMEDAVVASFAAGLDGLFTTTPTRGLAALHAAIADGRVSIAALDRAVSRILLNRFRVGEFDTNSPENPFSGPWDETRLDSAEHRALARTSMAASVVLLENVGDALPLVLQGQRVAVMGPFADCSERSGKVDAPDASVCTYAHSYNGATSVVSTVLSAAREEASSALSYAIGSGITVALPGAVAAAVALAASADVTVLVLGLGVLCEREGFDRTNFSLPAPQLELLRAVSAATTPARLVLVLVSAGGIDLGVPAASLAHAVLAVGYGGEEMGHGLWDVLTGRVSPSGRLAATWYANSYLATSVPSIADFDLAGPGWGRTYRYVDPAHVVYAFGHGASYASFAFSALAVSRTPECGAHVSVAVRNVGKVDAYEVVQIYVTPPRVAGLTTPAYALQAFTRVWLTAGTAPTVLTFTLSPDALRTTAVDGSRACTAGTHIVWAGGRLPSDDPTGSGASINVTLDMPATCSTSSHWLADVVVSSPAAPVAPPYISL